MGRLVITIGESLEASKLRLLANIRRAKAGLPVDVDTHINFPDARTMLAKLNVNRYEVLAFVAEHRPKSINAIAIGVGRGYRRVHDDVHALLELGLIDRQVDGSLSVGYDPNIRLAAGEQQDEVAEAEA